MTDQPAIAGHGQAGADLAPTRLKPLGSSFMTEGEQPAAEPQIMIDPGQMAGVWANFARVSHSPYEFTLDFARLDFAVNPPQGIVVARVSLSPLMVTQLIDALRTNWAIYAERSMPPEVQRDGQTPDEGSGGGPGAPGAPA